MPTIPEPLAIYIEGLKTHDVEKIGASFADDIAFVTPAGGLRSRIGAPLSRNGVPWKFAGR